MGAELYISRWKQDLLQVTKTVVFSNLAAVDALFWCPAHDPGGGELLSGLDVRPDPGAQPVIVLTEFGRQIQPRAQFGRRIDGRIGEYLAPDERPRRQIVVAVMDVVGDGGNDPRLENEIQELMRRLAVRRRGRNQQGVVRDVGAFL